MADLKGFEEYLISGRTMKAEVDGDLVAIKIGDTHEGMAPFEFEKEPSVFMAAIKRFEEKNPGFAAVTLMLQLKDLVVYRYKRIL
jgi:hypothetical protein